MTPAEVWAKTLLTILHVIVIGAGAFLSYKYKDAAPLITIAVGTITGILVPSPNSTVIGAVNQAARAVGNTVTGNKT